MSFDDIHVFVIQLLENVIDVRKQMFLLSWLQSVSSAVWLFLVIFVLEEKFTISFGDPVYDLLISAFLTSSLACSLLNNLTIKNSRLGTDRARAN